MILLLIAGFLLEPFFPTDRQSFKDSNGNIYTLVAVTYGTNHVYDPRTFRQKVMTSLPPQIKRLFRVRIPPGFQPVRSGMTNESIGLWFIWGKNQPSHPDVSVLDAGGKIVHGPDHAAAR